MSSLKGRRMMPWFSCWIARGYLLRQAGVMAYSPHPGMSRSEQKAHNKFKANVFNKDKK